MAVIKDVAKLAGVSVGTVSKYLNNKGNLKEETRKKVEYAINKLQYKPNPVARSMRTGKTNTIAIIAPDITNPFFAEIYNSIRQCAAQNGYVSILYTTSDDPKILKDYLTSTSIKQADGIILCFVDDDEDVAQFMDEIQKSVPIVMLSWNINNTRFNCVSIDVFEGAMKATNHLISLGHKRIGYVGGHDRVSVEKHNGFIKALKAAALESSPDLEYFGGFNLQTGFYATRKFCMLPDMPTAIFAENDIIAIGCIKYLLQNNIRVPEDVAVIGFDNIKPSAMYEPSLSTISLPIVQMGEESVKLLLSIMNKNTTKNKVLILKNELVVRNSTDKNAPIELEVI